MTWLQRARFQTSKTRKQKSYQWSQILVIGSGCYCVVCGVSFLNQGCSLIVRRLLLHVTLIFHMIPIYLLQEAVRGCTLDYVEKIYLPKRNLVPMNNTATTKNNIISKKINYMLIYEMASKNAPFLKKEWLINKQNNNIH